MDRIKQLITNAGNQAVPPEVLLRVFNDLFARQCLTSAGLTTGATATPTTGAAVTVAIVNGVTVRIAATTAVPTYTTAFSMTTGQHQLILTTVDGGGTLRNYGSNIPSSAAALTYPAIPTTECVIGGIYLAPTTTFTGGTTLLNAANINALAFNAVGPFFPVNTF